MAKRREFNGIAAGILGSFLGRNNDDDGYWAMGELYTFASERGVRTVGFDLLKPEASAVTPLIRRMASNYRNFLQSKCVKRGVLQWVASAA